MSHFSLCSLLPPVFLKDSAAEGKRGGNRLAREGKGKRRTDREGGRALKTKRQTEKKKVLKAKKKLCLSLFLVAARGASDGPGGHEVVKEFLKGRRSD